MEDKKEKREKRNVDNSKQSRAYVSTCQNFDWLIQRWTFHNDLASF